MDDTKNATQRLLSYFSDWNRVRISVVWFLKLKDAPLKLARHRREIQVAGWSDPKVGSEKKEAEMTKLRAVLGGQTVTVEDVSKAEAEIFSQRERFPVEVSNLEKGKAVKRKRDISRLDPLFEDGLLKVGGRLSKAAMPEEVKHPVILSKDQLVSKLILQHIHKLMGHAGRNHMLSTHRKKYWITNANSA